MSWFSKKKKELSSEEVSDLAKSLFADEAAEIKNKFIQLAIETLVSTVISPKEKIDTLNGISKHLHGDNPDSSVGDLRGVADKCYSFQLAHYTADDSLLSRIKMRYDEFTNLPEDSVVDDFGFQDIIKFSMEAYRYLEIELHENGDVTVKCKWDLAGLSYRDIREKETASNLDEGDCVILEKEPDNEYDKNAVKVITADGFHIGYVEKALSRYITENLFDIKETLVTDMTGTEISFQSMIHKEG